MPKTWKTYVLRLAQVLPMGNVLAELRYTQDGSRKSPQSEPGVGISATYQITASQLQIHSSLPCFTVLEARPCKHFSWVSVRMNRLGELEGQERQQVRQLLPLLLGALAFSTSNSPWSSSKEQLCLLPALTGSKAQLVRGGAALLRIPSWTHSLTPKVVAASCVCFSCVS